MTHLKPTALLTLVCAALLALSACGGTGGSSAGGTKPTVQILVPAYGASVTEGGVLNVQAVTTDTVGVTRVELYVDGQLANTKLSPNPQGDAQFTVTLEWLASKLGAHTVGVRAYNAAEAFGEITIPIAVNPLLTAATPVAIELTPVTEQHTLPAPDATDAPNPTDPPTDVPPTDIPPTGVLPTATLPPFAVQLPTDGGATVALNWSEDGLAMEAFANDSRVGGDNGDGIAYVEIFVQDLAGKVIAFKHDNHAPYCYFGDDNFECNVARPGTDAFVWRPGVPIRAGWYFVRAVAHTPDNHILVDERPLRLNNPPDSFENVFQDIYVEQQTDNVQRELSFEAEISGAGTGSGIDRIEMSIALYNGEIVHTRTERTARYCAFSGGDNGAPCPDYQFAPNGFKWSSGASIYPTNYLLRAVGYLKDGTVVAASTVIRITRVQ